MRVAILGSKGTTLDFLQFFREKFPQDLVAVISLGKDLAVKNSVANYQGEELAEHCAQSSTLHYFVKSYNLQNSFDVTLFEHLKLDFLLVIGWERLIPDQILKNVRLATCGMHGSPFGLPRGRGRSPLNWSLILGHKKFITYLFKYLPGIDDGPIVGAEQFEINDHDTISSLHHKNRIAMQLLVEKYLPLMEQGKADFISQSAETATYFPKRAEQDGAIDWNDTTENIYNLIRAISPPYPGAFTFLQEKKIRIHEAKPFDRNLFSQVGRPGEILDISLAQKNLVVKTLDGSLLLTQIHIENWPQLKVGMTFHGPSKEQTLAEIRGRYHQDLGPEQKEV